MYFSMSNSVTVDVKYSSCATNKSPHILDWGFNGTICFGSCNAVDLYLPQENKQGGRVYQTLVAHKQLVTSVHWIRRGNGEPETELVSTSADKTAVIWTLSGSRFLPAHILQGHEYVVTASASLYLDNDDYDLLVATTAADSTVKIWQRKKQSVICCQTISFGNGLGLDVCFGVLKLPNVPILAVGCDDAKIRLYCRDEFQQFSPVVVLEGHEDWVRSLDFTTDVSGTLLLASASQDQFIRIWKIAPKNEEVSDDGELKVKENLFSTCAGDTYAVSLESVLAGHENWIYSVKWRPQQSKDTTTDNRLQLLSASMDKTMIIWEPDPVSKIWFEKVRVGEVGGNTLGFYGGVFSPDGTTIVGHVFHGAVHMWNYDEKLECWHPGVSFGGHFSSVKDIDWDPDGSFLLSCSQDQTTRIHAPFVNDNMENNWHEIARPQVHGYDMACLCVLGRYKFVSSGDEKVLRVFEAPRSFAENLRNICELDTSSHLMDLLPDGASVPSLGLSNKAVYEEDILKASKSDAVQKHAKDYYPDFYYTPVTLNAPPTEELLIQNTLWPEIQKLYGHPYEVFAVTSNHKKTIVASSCKASKAEHAAIILWSIATWKQLGRLVFHNLTVTQMEFSPDDEYLLSVSRDRMWVLYRYFPEDLPPYRKIANLEKGSNIHTRIIWSCSWSHDSLNFATSSRDKKIAIWSKRMATADLHTESILELPEFSLSSAPYETEDSATAVAFAPCFTLNERYLLAIGLQNGKILLCTWHNSDYSAFPWNLIYTLDYDISHHLNVNRLKFSPTLGQAGDVEKESSDVIQLASCSDDYHVKIYNIWISFIS